MILITYRRQPVAVAGAERFHLAPHIAALPDGDPLKRFVCFLVLYARDVQTGQLPREPRRYQPQRAERYAREALIPARDFAALAHRGDSELAAHFGVPLEQIAHRRDDLTAQRAAMTRRRRPRPHRRRACQLAGDRRGTARP